MATPPEHAVRVGVQFVRLYYRTLNTQPQELYKFYASNSAYTYGWEGNDKEDSVRGVAAIRSKLEAQQLGYVKVMSVVSCQESANNGVVVLVTGSWEPAEQQGRVSRRFMETFFLEPQRPEGYAIKNDIVYILQNSPPNPAEVQKAKPDTSAPVAESAAPAPAPEKRQSADESVSSAAAAHAEAPEEEEDEKRDEEPAQDAHEQASEADSGRHEETAEAPSTAAAASAAASAPSQAESAAPRTWANRFRPTAEEKSVTQRQAQQQPQQQAQPQQAQQTRPAKARNGPAPSAAPSSAAPAASGEVQRLYVAQLPQSVTIAKIKSVFSAFGNVTSVSLNQKGLFAFVESTDATFVARALAAAEAVSVDGKKVVVEKSKSSSSGSAGSGRGRSSSSSGRGAPRGGRGASRGYPSPKR